MPRPVPFVNFLVRNTFSKSSGMRGGSLPAPHCRWAVLRSVGIEPVSARLPKSSRSPASVSNEAIDRSAKHQPRSKYGLTPAGV
eukprot:3763818-Prymnesium_polylepis.1